MIAVYYLRPYLIRERDERERQLMTEKIKDMEDKPANRENERNAE